MAVAEANPAGLQGDGGQGDEGVPPGFGHPDRGEALGLGLAGKLEGFFERDLIAVQTQPDLHTVLL